MHQFWVPVLGPLLEAIEARVVVEVGAESGRLTRPLLEHCREHGGVVHAIDPEPQLDVAAWEREFGEHLVFHRRRSLDVLGELGSVDAALIDGDHNWYTVINELRLLAAGSGRAARPFPLVALHDVDWPYGRRDLYYSPQAIPPEHRHPSRHGGIDPEHRELRGEGFNDQHANALEEGGPRAGVRTAIEDFIAESPLDFEFLHIPGDHGLGVLLSSELLTASQPLREQQVPRLRSATFLMRRASEIESGRARELVKRAQVARALKRRDRELERRAEELRGMRAELRSARERAAALEAGRAAHERFQRAVRSERIETAEAARRIVESRSWRLGHRLMRSMRALTLRGSISPEGAPERLAEQLELRVERQRPLAELRRGAPAWGALGPTPAEPGTAGGSRGRPPAIEDAHIQRLLARPPVSVVIPVHNAAEELRRCVDSVLRNTAPATELLVIDDASTDPGVAALLTQLGELDGVRVVRNERNAGFAATVNRGFELSEGDVVLLNSDAEVTPGWLANLTLAAYSDDAIATVTPVSDNAGAFSVPRAGEANDFPRNASRDCVGRMVTRASERRYPRTPTGNGFCMFIKRAALDAIGAFDADAFERGYGEENDFCMRAGRAGWIHVVDDATLVFHRRAASFGAEKATLLERGRRVLDARYPDYTERVREFARSSEMESVRESVRGAYHDDPLPAQRPRLLLVLHEGRGATGTPQTNLDLIGAIGDRYECFVLTCDARRLRLCVEVEGELRAVDSWELEEPLAPTDFTRADYRAIVASVLVSHAIELVHVRHLFKHTLDMPQVARALGIGVVLSFHDFYLSCPTVHLLDERLRYCGGVCTPGEGECRVGSPALVGLPPLKHRWVYEWRTQVDRMLADVDACVTTSRHARSVLARSLHRVRELPFEVIEHGRDLDRLEGAWSLPSPDAPVRILVAGNLPVHKGAQLVRALHAQDTAGRLEFHFAGSHLDDGLEAVGTCHGPYRREEFNDLVRMIRPSFIACLSIWGETWCHVLTEAWAAGVPVLASDIGTLRERVRAHGGGWLLDHTDPMRAYAQIMEICADHDGYRRVAAQAAREAGASVAAMGDRYDALYGRVLEGRPAPEEQRSPARRAGRRPRVMRLGVFTVGANGFHPASTYVRCVQRFSHPDVRRFVKAAPARLEGFLGGADAYDALLVQRTALPPERVDEFIATARGRGLPYVFELDDDLLDGSDGSPASRAQYGPHVAGMRRLAAASALTTVSTEPLRVRVERFGRARNVTVVPNMLDERLWMHHYGETPIARARSGDAPGETLRLLYMGTRTHSEDLALIRPALERLREDGIDVRLDVIGGEAPPGGAGWYRSIAVPPDSRAYPRFVPWLRGLGGGWDAAVAPLRDSPFNRCKSDLKLLEYAALGLPGAYSDIGVYDAACDGGKRGLLVENEETSWYAALRSLHGDADRRAHVREHAYDYVAQRRLLAHAARDYVETLAGVV